MAVRTQSTETAFRFRVDRGFNSLKRNWVASRRISYNTDWLCVEECEEVEITFKDFPFVLRKRIKKRFGVVGEKY